MTSEQIIGLALIVAGLGDLVAIPLMRQRLPPPQARTLSILLVGFAAAMIGLGIAILVKGSA
jgi:hypothetical protein